MSNIYTASKNYSYTGTIVPQFANPNIVFGNCNLSAQFIPCTVNSNNTFEITNNGGATTQAIFALAIAGHTPEGTVEQVGELFSIGAGESGTLTVTLHFATDYWTQTENISITFYIGYLVGTDQMTVTDTITFSTQIYIPGGNGACAGKTQAQCTNPCYWCTDHCQDTECGITTDCEKITSGKTACEAAKCKWYPYPNPFGDAQCWKEEMYMKYLPFIIAGVGGVIVLMALMSRSPKPMYYPRD
jgi:hypothetical protein